MTRILQFVMAGLLCCVMAFSAAAQQDKGGHGKGGGKEPRDITREPKGGDRGGQGGNPGNANRGDPGNQGGGKGQKGGKRGDRPNDL